MVVPIYRCEEQVSVRLRWSEEIQKACSLTGSEKQAFKDVTRQAELGQLRLRGYGVDRFLSYSSNASDDASFSSTERPETPTVEPISHESRSESNRPRRRMRP